MAKRKYSFEEADRWLRKLLGIDLYNDLRRLASIHWYEDVLSRLEEWGYKLNDDEKKMLMEWWLKVNKLLSHELPVMQMLVNSVIKKGA